VVATRLPTAKYLGGAAAPPYHYCMVPAQNNPSRHEMGQREGNRSEGCDEIRFAILSETAAGHDGYLNAVALKKV
jgi:hypothetical protein